MLFNKENLVRALQGLPEIIESYFKNIPDTFLDRKRNETSWTIREHLYHIAEVQEMLYMRILKIRDEVNPVITPFFPENELESVSKYQSIQQAISCYKTAREKQISLINQLTGTDFSKEAKHDEYIAYNVPIIMNHIIFHEYWHVYRIEELWLTRDEYFA